MNAIYRWLANHLPLTLVKLCAIRALETYAAQQQYGSTPLYDAAKLRDVTGAIRLWASNAAIGF